MKTSLLAIALLSGGLAIASAADLDNDYVAHEWGTFTSVQGADGVQMFWDPLVAPDLPRFVYDRQHLPHGNKFPVIVGGKIGVMARQRMETPVIYFYSDRLRTV